MAADPGERTGSAAPAGPVPADGAAPQDGSGPQDRARPQEPAAPQEGSAQERRPWWRRLLSNLAAPLVVLLIVALLRTFVIQTFVIPSGSMEDTLQEGDRVAVAMYDSSDIERGDVVVFVDPDNWLGSSAGATGIKGVLQSVLVAVHLLPEHAGHHLIKRVIGVAGDHIVADGQGSLTINGVEVDEPYLKAGRSASDIAFDVTVPEGYVWVMGDNRSNSADSRYHQDDAHGGMVPLSDVVGVARWVVWPLTRIGSLSAGREALASIPSATASASPQSTRAP